jgi:MHS family proline/betaine transporter-like MFS transporter
MTAWTLTQPQAGSHWRAIVAASIGNALEWFDFAVYGFFALTISKLFFPVGDQATSLLLTFGTFGVTFFMRPLGAIVLGRYADRSGRKAALVLIIGLMMLGTAIIAVVPTYASIGIAAPVAIVIARMLQGFSAGGEFGSATAFLAEQNPLRRGFFASWQLASQGITTVLATGFGAVLSGLLSPAELEAWGWRTPFVFGLLIGPVAYYIRKRIDEAPEFRSIVPSEAPLRETVSGEKLSMLISLGVVVFGTVATYMTLFMPTYAVRQLGLPAAGSFAAGLLYGVIQILLIPVFGALSDRYGRLPIPAVCAVAALLATYPMFIWLANAPTLQTLLWIWLILGVLVAGYHGSIPALMSELFPTRTRTSGLSISYSFGVMIFGGFAPFIMQWLIELTGSKLAPGYYLMLAAVISLVALAAARRVGCR